MKNIKYSVTALLLSLIIFLSSGCNTQNSQSDASAVESIFSSVTVSEEQGSDNASSASSKADSRESTPVSPVGNGQAVPLDPNNLPVYSGKPYAVINNNIPNFSVAELTDKGYEKYGSLDSLGRCTAATASCGKEIMPKENEKRGSISRIKPTGWVQAQYDSISGKYLYNRCHLIGWQLSAENDNRQNLITGTKYMNVSGMLPFENMVADYIKETGNHVAYRVTPVFCGDNLLASGVQIEAYSVEDSGGICFNVYCFNLQPDIVIDYKDGSSALKTPEITAESSYTESAYSEPTKQTERVEQPTDSAVVYRTPTGKRFHLISTCGGANSYSVTREQALAAGLTPCKKCAA